MGRHRQDGPATSRIRLTLSQAIRDQISGGVDARRVAPGRVNLIGEHTDYSNLPVLPMAIGRSVSVSAALSRVPGVRIDSERISQPIIIEPSTRIESLFGWHRYAAAAFTVAGAGELGADILIGGDLPSH